jgi:hypothetical protein
MDPKEVFYIDSTKKHAYIYNEREKLYKTIDRPSIKKGNYVEINIDIRKNLDKIYGMIPIVDGKILDIITGKIIERNKLSYFTYELSGISPYCGDFFKNLITNDYERFVFKKFLYNALITYSPQKYILIKASVSARKIFTELLLKLHPIIDVCDPCFYYSFECSKSKLEKIYRAKLVICETDTTKTIRIAQPCTMFPFTVQYHGLLFHDEGQIKINDIENKNLPSEKEFLYWILNE